MPTRSGYSGKPLYQKLGIKEEHGVLFVNAPEQYIEWLELPFSTKKLGDGDLLDMVHIFAKEKAYLESELNLCLGQLKQNGMIWISWPKKASKVVTDITEDVVRAVVFPLGLVDIKVCSVSDVWSGLKVVIRKENRK